MKPFFQMALAGASILVAGMAQADTFAEIKINAGHDLFNKECRRCHADDSGP